MREVKTCCQEEGIVGSGTKSWVATHRLRVTLATLLFESGHADSSVSLRTGQVIVIPDIYRAINIYGKWRDGVNNRIF